MPYVGMQLEQQPLFGGDGRDAAAMRRWRRKLAEDEVSLLGRLPSRLVLIGTDFVRVGKLTPDDELEDQRMAAVFNVGARQPDVVRALREGEAVIDGRRVLALLEYNPLGRSFWLATRHFGANAVEVGVFHGEWIEREGVGLDELEEPFRDWVDIGGLSVELTEATTTAKPLDLPDIRVATRRLTAALPKDVRAFTDRVGEFLDRELVTGTLPGDHIITFHGRDIEHAVITGKTSIPFDDLIRAFAARGPADAVVVVHPGIVDYDGVKHRAFLMEAEYAGTCHVRALMLRFGANGKIDGFKVVHQEAPAVGPQGRWLGVAPTSGTIDLFPMGRSPLGPQTGEA